ncbi:unnamed protein product [Lasius platythorax]|uniref:Uncharacterized protein n=1 Tax=Lasius platythorax TaxID=488582 RepID=A0AAV2NPT8_9HYME
MVPARIDGSATKIFVTKKIDEQRITISLSEDIEHTYVSTRALRFFTTPMSSGLSLLSNPVMCHVYRSVRRFRSTRKDRKGDAGRYRTLTKEIRGLIESHAQ